MAALLRRRDQRGNALLEAALVTPVFLVLIFGVIEGGFGLHERLSVANMALVGARSATGNANDALADEYVLAAIRNGAGGVASSQIGTIVVYKASGPGDHVPTTCKTTSVAGICNRYTGADLAKDSTQFGCAGPPGPVTKIDSYWCPSTRKAALTGVNGPPDHIGVYVSASHRNFTGIFGTGLTFRSDTVMRIEPRTLR
ncbi:MAG: hypothetical protein QOJ69_1453 [Actinomycetota bacterium]|nr:hypothetical protein [Actinomycetota bacterium]